MTDAEMIEFFEENKQYVLGHAPSGDWSVFSQTGGQTCYGKTVRECVEQAKIMHMDITGR